ncbi:MAG: hypothetical protein IJY71_01480 [Clostridia bacterium]|nr:hypothetical protein [Clostridia bacterium]MBQ9130202.1 hypothetical protein [Clostridia bacterium]
MKKEATEEIAALEKTLSYLIHSEMRADEKIKALRDSFFRSHNTGYCNYMAGQEQGGVEDSATRTWDLDCRYKYEVARLLTLLEEQE